MKVVLFCGGLGTRLREHSETVPKPLVNIGYRPLIWHLMKYYAYYGHKDFILCLGYRGDLIKEFFLKYDECMSNNFTLGEGGRRIELENRDVDDWRITFVETGMHSNIGQRLLRVRDYVAGDEVFLANYSDGLSDLPFPDYLDRCLSSGATASFLSVRTPQSLHAVHADGNGVVTDFGRVRESEFWINGGFFVFRQGIFDVLQEGEELVETPFQRLIAKRKLFSYRYSGFWKAMDTFKDKIEFDRMHAKGESPWAVWLRDKIEKAK
jgi:glucose-1-phosphate cytidylyltransferase